MSLHLHADLRSAACGTQVTDAQVNQIGADVLFGGLFGTFVTEVTLPRDAGIEVMLVVFLCAALGGLLSVRRTAVEAQGAKDIK